VEIKPLFPQLKLYFGPHYHTKNRNPSSNNSRVSGHLPKGPVLKLLFLGLAIRFNRVNPNLKFEITKHIGKTRGGSRRELDGLLAFAANCVGFVEYRQRNTFFVRLMGKGNFSFCKPLSSNLWLGLSPEIVVESSLVRRVKKEL